nr:tetratricopeptide repeat protein [uncultured Stomatobaculum sp.]
MKKQKLATVVLAAGLVLGIAVFVGYESTRYTRTVQKAEQEWQLGDTEEAIPIYEKAIRMKPKRAEAYLSLAEIYERNNRHADAVTLLKTAAEAMSGKTSKDAALIQEALERYNPTVKASLESGSYEDPVELELTSKGVSIRYTLLEAPESESAEEQDYEKPLRFRRNGTYRLQCYAVNQKGEAGEPVELGYVIQLDPEKYHMNSWYQKDNGWYYNDDTGVPVVGWRQIDGNWYHFAENGKMMTGWLELGDNFYYLDENGVIANGWRNVDGKYYYFLEDGSMAVNRWVDGDYYVGADGVMLVSTMTPDGYQLDENGKKIEKSQNEKAVEAYRNILLDRSWNGRKLPGGQFAVVDINGDGVWELLTDLDAGYDDSIDRLFYFTDSLQMYALDSNEYDPPSNLQIWDVFIPSNHTVIIGRRRGKQYTSAMVQSNNQMISEPEEGQIGWPYVERYKEESGVTAEQKKSLELWRVGAKKYYSEPCYYLNFVDINAANVDKYLSGQGQSTGMQYAFSEYPGVEYLR